MRALRTLRCLWRQEFGQGLVLAALGMVVILGFAAMAVDVGFWYSQRGEVQKAVDAAALAGAWELPDDYAAAEAKTREYLVKNGVDEAEGDTISITFRCTSTYLIACNPSTNHWDTIVVEVERPAEAWFARIFGIEEALIRDVRAAGCNGPCGGAAFAPVDVVQILDRTGSMTMGAAPNWLTPRMAPGRCWSTSSPACSGSGWGCCPPALPGATPVRRAILGCGCR